MVNHFIENVMIRDCIINMLSSPPYPFDQYEIDDLEEVLKKYENVVDESIKMAGAMDILIKGENP
jgi:hypothetical protein